MRGANKLQTNVVQRFVVWKQIKVAPSKKTNKKSNKRGPRGLCPSLGRRPWGSVGPKWPLSGAQGLPRRSLAGCKKAIKTNAF